MRRDEWGVGEEVQGRDPQGEGRRSKRREAVAVDVHLEMNLAGIPSTFILSLWVVGVVRPPTKMMLPSPCMIQRSYNLNYFSSFNSSCN